MGRELKTHILYVNISMKVSNPKDTHIPLAAVLRNLAFRPHSLLMRSL